MANATRIAFAGIDLIRHRPRAVLAWGFVYLAVVIVMNVLTRPMMERMLAAVPAGGVAPGAMAFDGEAFSAIMLGNLGVYAAMLVLLAAAMRAVLKPEEQAAFFIRLGMDELRLCGTILLLLAILGLFYVVSAMALGVVAAILVFAAAALGVTAASTGAQAATMLFVAALVLAEFSLLLVVQVRFAPALPLTILHGRIVIREAWRRSKGHFSGLLGGFLLNGLIVSVVAMVALMPMWWALLEQGGGWLRDPRAYLAAMRSPILYSMWLLTPLLGGFTIAMMMAHWVGR